MFVTSRRGFSLEDNTFLLEENGTIEAQPGTNSLVFEAFHDPTW